MKTEKISKQDCGTGNTKKAGTRQLISLLNMERDKSILIINRWLKMRIKAQK